MRIEQLFLATLVAFLPLNSLVAQDILPSISPTATYMDEEGNEATADEDNPSFFGQAPLEVTFHANPSDMIGFLPSYEWDQRNDVFMAKEYQSLVEFHAYIFNRWGQKLFEWTDPSEGWDGTHNGTPVKEGVYFVLVRAKGADGREYNIRKDVNLLRGYTEETSRQ